VKDIRLCAVCAGRVSTERHKHGGKFCSKRCEIEQSQFEEKKELEYLKEGINALGYKQFAKRGKSFHHAIIIGDTHFPFHSRDIISKIVKRIKLTQPKFVIQVGDLYDFFSQSKYPRTHRLMTPEEEVLQGRVGAEEMWASIHKACPDSKKIQLLGNHDVRPYKRLLEKCPELEPFFKIDHLFKFPQVETVLDPRQELVIDGVLYQHGHRKHGEHMKISLMPTVHGHTHRAGISYLMLRNQLIWEMDVGMVADIDSVPMSYAGTKWSSCTQGVGEITSDGPRFIHAEQL
jgi:predicted phosphodiesterase